MNAGPDKVRRVAITGADGFIGTALCAALEANDAYSVKRLLQADGFELQDALADEWRKGFEGSDICIHLASLLPWSGDNFDASAEERFLNINAYASRTLLRALHAEGGGHFVFLSTIGVNGIVSGPSPFTPQDEPNPAGNYARSKWLAEQLLAEEAEKLGMKLTIFRPPMIYGAGVRGSFAKLIRQVQTASWLPYANIQNQRDMIGLRNLVELLVATLDQETTGTFLIKDRDPVSTTSLVQAIAELSGSRPGLFSIPPLLRAVMMHLPVVSGIAARLFGDVRIDDGDFARLNSWQPRFRVMDELEHMFRDTVGPGH